MIRTKSSPPDGRDETASESDIVRRVGTRTAAERRLAGLGMLFSVATSGLDLGGGRTLNKKLEQLNAYHFTSKHM